MDSLFGGEMTGAARFIIAFVVVLALIALSAWLVRRFGRGSFSSAAARGRQPRLAVIDAASVDARRRLILVRRDNIEHLVMIGGPTDVVIEQNIVRATAAPPRDVNAGRAAHIGETIPRAVSLDDGAMWPLQPEPSHRPQRAEPPMQWTPPAQGPEAPRPEAPPVRADPLTDRVDGRAAPPQPASPRLPEPEPEHQPRRQYATPATDQNLAAMAQRLESALRRTPAAEPRLDGPATEAPRHEEASSSSEAAPAAAEKPHAAAGQPAPGQSKKFYEALEQEMASLLGRSSGKT